MLASPAPMTAAELLIRQPSDKRSELIAGRMVVREPAGLHHGGVAAQLLIAVGSHVARERLGRVVAAETGFTLRRNPDTVRAADVAFIRADRWPAAQTTGFGAIAPDLVAEVLSPGDRERDVQAKVADWLTAGTLLVWIIDPIGRVVRVYRPDASVTTVVVTDELNGESVLPGFVMRVSELFE